MEELLYSLFLLLLILGALSVIWLHIYIYVRRNFSSASKIPGESGNFYLGTMREIVAPGQHISGVLLRWVQKHPDTPLLRYNFLMGELKVLVTDPELLKHVLITNSTNYNKNLSSYLMVKKHVLGKGLVTLDGEFHTQRRALVNDAFNYKYLKNFVRVFSLQTKKLMELWDSQLNGELVPVQHDLLNLALNIIGLTSFGYDFDTLTTDKQTYNKSLAKKFIDLPKIYRMTLLTLMFPFYNSIPLPGNKRKEKAKEVLNASVEDIVRAKQENLKHADPDSLNQPRDLLDIIVNLKDENGQSLSTADLIDEAKTFILAGHETTATAINFALYLLAMNPEHSDIVAKEVDEVLGDRDQIEPEDLDKFKYLNMVIKETLRMFPPVPAVARYCVEPETLAGYVIPKGTAVNISPFVMHYHPKYWNEPEKFDPLRWTPEEVAKRNPHQYLPFLLGPRNCIGQKFGTMELKCILAMLVRRYEFSLPVGWKMTPKSFISIRATPRIKMYIRPRNK